MIKIIHTADIHLGSKINANLSGEKMEKRRLEVRGTFMRLVDFAKENDVKAIMLCGDVFESDNPFKKDKDWFYNLVEKHPDIDFLYLRGNHDSNSESPLNKEFSNLILFDEDWSYKTYGNVVIGGIELKDVNKKSLYSTLNLNGENINIVMLHGNVSSSEGKDNILINKLKDKNIDYLALGHIHAYKQEKLDARGVYAYSGCLEGRGNDETGEKGFVLLTISNTVESQFIPFSKRQIVEEIVDITDIADAYSVYQKVKTTIKTSADNLLRVILTGENVIDDTSLESDLEKMLENDYFSVTVKDKTTKKIDISKYEKDLSLQGEFVREVYANSELTDEEKSKIIKLGIKALTGGKIDD